MKNFFWPIKLAFFMPALFLVFGYFVVPVFAETSVVTNAYEETAGSYSMGGNVTSDEWIQSRGVEVEEQGNKHDLFDYANVAYSHVQTIQGSAGSNSLFNLPRGIYTDASGDLLIADTYNNRIQKFDTDGNMIMQFGGLGSGNGQMNRPQGVTTDASGNIYVADTNNNRIQKFTSTGTYITQWGSSGNGNSQFSSPIGIAVYNGEVFVSDFLNDRIQVFNTNGVFLRTWGSNGSEPGQLYWPRAIKIDSSGSIYVAEQANNRVQKFDIYGNSLLMIDTTGYVNSFGSGFVNVNGVTIDSEGNIFVVHSGRHQILKFNSEGEFLLRWGDEGNIGTGAYQFNFPYDITTDNEGNVYVADTSNNRIQKFAPFDIPGGDFTQTDFEPNESCGALNYRAYAVVDNERIYGEYMTIDRPKCVDFTMDINLEEPGLVEGEIANYTFIVGNDGGSYDASDYNGAEITIVVPDELEIVSLTDGVTFECEDFTADAETITSLTYHLGNSYTCRPLQSYGAIEPGQTVELTIPFNIVGSVSSSTTMRAINFGGDAGSIEVENAMYDSDDDIFTFESNNIAIYQGRNPGSTIGQNDSQTDTNESSEEAQGRASRLASTGSPIIIVSAVCLSITLTVLLLRKVVRLKT